MFSEKSSEILKVVASMNEAQFAAFVSGLAPDTLEYLEVLLAKFERENE